MHNLNSNYEKVSEKDNLDKSASLISMSACSFSGFLVGLLIRGQFSILFATIFFVSVAAIAGWAVRSFND